MQFLPQHADLEAGYLLTVNGQRLRHMGGGWFQPEPTVANEDAPSWMKRFDPGGPLQRFA